MRVILLAVASVLMNLWSAQAAPECEPATDAAERMLPSGNTTEFLTGLNVSLILALTPSTFPKENISAATEPCLRGDFTSAERQYLLFGSDSDSPSRWAVSVEDDRIAYLALAPPPRVALDWYNETNRTGSLNFGEAPVYIAAITDGTTRNVYAVFHSIPSDAQLTKLFQASLDGKSKRLLSFDILTNEMDVTSTADDW